jgi:hypothetical protein
LHSFLIFYEEDLQRLAAGTPGLLALRNSPVT